MYKYRMRQNWSFTNTFCGLFNHEENGEIAGELNAFAMLNQFHILCIVLFGVISKHLS